MQGISLKQYAKNHSELRKTHVHRLIVPIEQFMIYLVAIIALYELHFPESWNIHLFKLTLQQVIESAVKFFFIVLFIRVCLRTLEFVSIVLEEKAKLTKDQTDDQLILFFITFIPISSQSSNRMSKALARISSI